jgi:hypothetical protein
VGEAAHDNAWQADHFPARGEGGARAPGGASQRSNFACKPLVAWARNGPSKLPNLVLLCYFHHRQVHEGGWQVVKVGREFRFIPPDRMVMRRHSPTRWGRWREAPDGAAEPAA